MAPHNIYVGLAGETESYPGYPRRTGLLRSAGGDGPWERCMEGLPAGSEVRALAIHPDRPRRIFAGTQDGIWVSDDAAGSWRRTAAPAPGMAVWSLAFRPGTDDLYAGYEPCALWVGRGGGEHWEPVAMAPAFPEVTQHPRMLPKRPLGIAFAPGPDGAVLVAVEVGGLLRGAHGGGDWAQLLPGPFANDDPLDLHSVLVRPDGGVLVSGRKGLVSSPDGGRAWEVPRVAPPAAPDIYSRALCALPDEPDTLFLAAGGPFDDQETVMRWGMLLRSADGGRHWTPVGLDPAPASTLFQVAADAGLPGRVVCASYGGEVYRSDDRGLTWHAMPLPDGADQIYAVAAG